ncbi:Uncharacterised protein [Mycobacteroides abscessus subsp. massiliense]|nr:Uncharacterised protein [Mycobacteroides abscessus subsp. massiliense]
MCGDQDHRTRRLIDFPALDADQPVFHHVQATHALCARPAVELDDGLQHADRVAVDGSWYTLVEGDDQLVGCAPVQGRVFGVVVHIFGRRVPKVFQEAGFHRASPHVLIDRERRLLRHVDRNLVLCRERDRLLAGPRVVTHRRQYFQIGCQRGKANLEAHLIVALAGAAVGDDPATVLACRGDQVLDDQRTADRGHQRVPIHVQRVGLDRG